MHVILVGVIVLHANASTLTATSQFYSIYSLTVSDACDRKDSRKPNVDVVIRLSLVDVSSARTALREQITTSSVAGTYSL